MSKRFRTKSDVLAQVEEEADAKGTPDGEPTVAQIVAEMSAFAAVRDVLASHGFEDAVLRASHAVSAEKA